MIHLKPLLFMTIYCAMFGAADARVLIRAGEHGGFSRIVIPDAPDGWSISDDGTMFKVKLPTEEDYILTELIEKRLAHRVQSATFVKFRHQGELTLIYTCNCLTRASLSEDNSIIIDIYDREKISEKTLAPEAAAADEAALADSLQQARDRMIALLAEANSNGAVRLKSNATQELAKATSNSAPQIFENVRTPQQAKLGSTALNEAAPSQIKATNDCPEQSLLNARPDDNTISFDDISLLRKRMENADGSERAELELQLANLYMRLGFFEEAGAIASSYEGAANLDMAAIAAAAWLGTTGSRDRAPDFSPLIDCDIVYEAMQITAAARTNPKAIIEFSDAHIESFELLTAALSGAAASNLALATLDQENFALAQRLYEVARNASGDKSRSALTVIESALQEPSSEDGALKSDLINIARTPGAMQSRALNEIARKAIEINQEPYDGFLTDMAEFATNSAPSIANANTLTSGAKALAAGGRYTDALLSLKNAADSNPSFQSAIADAAASIFATAFSSTDPHSTYSALDAYLSHSDVVHDKQTLNNIAAKLAAHGASELTERVLAKVNKESDGETETLRTKALYLAGDYEAVANVPAQFLNQPKIVHTVLRALEKTGQFDKAASLIDTMIGEQVDQLALAEAALRIGSPDLAVRAFGNINPQNLEPDSAETYALAAISKGAALPESAADNIEDKQVLASLSHMFASAPDFKTRHFERAAKFAAGVKSEISYIEGEIGDE